MRTEREPQEILTQIRALDDEGGDMFGVIRTRLIEALPYGTAKPFLLPTVTETEWETLRGEYEDAKAVAHGYMPFAASKIVAERGLSAARNVDHMKALVYLHCGQPALEELEATDYGWYGRTQMAKAAELFGLSQEWAGILALVEGADD